jgi:hypothetical protein
MPPVQVSSSSSSPLPYLSPYRQTQALAKLHLRRGEVEECRALCTTITKLNPDNEEAMVCAAAAALLCPSLSHHYYAALCACLLLSYFVSTSFLTA